MFLFVGATAYAAVLERVNYDGFVYKVGEGGEGASLPHQALNDGGRSLSN